MDKARILYNGKEYDIELSEELKKQFNIEQHKERFIPKTNDKFFFVYKPKGENEYFIACNTFTNYAMDFCIIQNTFVFATEEDAEEYKQYLEMVDKYSYNPEWYDFNEVKFSLYYCFDTDDIHVFESENSKDGDIVYFPNENCAEEFIFMVGTDKIKRFMFNVWE